VTSVIAALHNLVPEHVAQRVKFGQQDGGDGPVRNLRRDISEKVLPVHLGVATHGAIHVYISILVKRRIGYLVENLSVRATAAGPTVRPLPLALRVRSQEREIGNEDDKNQLGKGKIMFHNWGLFWGLELFFRAVKIEKRTIRKHPQNKTIKFFFC
jgi:hypothetical protein